MNIFDRLQQSSFRSKFHLSNQDIEYIEKKGLKKIEEHARDFIQKRLAPQNISNDGKQTPMRGHPVFVAQHATATCCRGCLYKWHHISSNKELSMTEQNYIVQIIMIWIQNEIRNRK